MIRAFVAIELDSDLRGVLAKAQSLVKERLAETASSARIQWVRMESLHLTLKFLGEINEALVPDIERALGHAVAGTARFAVQVGGYGVFPDARAPRVLWIGLADPHGALARLAGAVERAMQPLGFAPEPKGFSPHLTLARIKDGSREVGRAMPATGLLGTSSVLGSLTVEAVALMKSELKPSGAVYTRLVEVPLLAP